MNRSHRAAWQLPIGVSRGLWEYATADHIADGYDDYFAFNRLFELDGQVLARHFHLRDDGPTWVADLGCGTGRALVPLVERGFHGLAVDLSQRMLEIVEEKAHQGDLPIVCVRANLVELDCLPDASLDYAMSLFSTLGMIRGWRNRVQAMRETRRILKPGGVFVLHLHNYWYNLYDPGGPWWVISNWLQSWFSREVEAGDRYFEYRGVPNMFLHVFTRGEIKRLLRASGFRLRELIPLDTRRDRLLPRPWLLQSLRANGWIIVCD
ncbi:MAG: methyltransferase domain-containing protein [Pirellulaceae bacterium]